MQQEPSVNAGQIFGAGVTTLMQGGLNGLLAERNAEIQKDLYDYTAQQAYMYGEKSADRADIRTRLLYNDLYSPQAQMQQIKGAGLSPSLFYGDTAGISGQTGAQGTGAAGAQTNAFGISPIELADIQLKNAQTRNLEEKTKTEAGVNDRGAAEIDSIVADSHNKTLQAVWQEYQNALSEVDLTVEASLQDTKIKNYVTQTEYLTHLTESAEAKAEIDQKSKNDILSYLRERTQNLMADTILKKTENVLKHSQMGLTNTQIQDLKSQINVREAQVEINQDWLESQVQQWSVQNGLQEKLNNAQIKGIVNNIWQGWVEKLADVIHAIKR